MGCQAVGQVHGAHLLGVPLAVHDADAEGLEDGHKALDGEDDDEGFDYVFAEIDVADHGAGVHQREVGEEVGDPLVVFVAEE